MRFALRALLCALAAFTLPAAPLLAELPAPLVRPDAQIAVAKLSRPRLSLSPAERNTPNGSFIVEAMGDGVWQRLGAARFGMHYGTRTLVLSKAPPAEADGSVRLRIRKLGEGAGHLDRVLLNGQPPTGGDAVHLRKLAARNSDVIEVEPAGVELVFAAARKQGARNATLLSLTGRIEPKEISKEPFRYPLANIGKPITPESDFYAYTLGSKRGALTVDGDINGEALGEPFFSAYYPVGSGHPQGSTYGWVRDDGKNLYVAFDFTSDNTRDGGADYGKVYVNTPAGVREFKVTTEEASWGRTAFAYTERVAYEHKTYEFAIPLRELGLDSAVRSGRASLGLAFAVYGTSAPIRLNLSPNEPEYPAGNGITPDSGSVGDTFTFIIEWEDTSGPATVAEVWIDLDGDGEADGNTLPVLSLMPLTPRNGPGSAVLLVGAAALLLLLALRTRKAQPALALGAACVAIGLVIAACSGSDNPPAGPAIVHPDCSESGEVCQMSLVNPPWPPADVADYFIDIEITQAGTYNFSYYFLGGDGSTTDQTLAESFTVSP